MIGVVRINQYRGELLNGSSSSSDTKLDLIYAFGTTTFHFRVILYSSYSEMKKKSIFLEMRKLEMSLDVCWKKVEGSKRHLLFFRSTLRLIAAEARVYFRRSFDLTSPCENVRARLNF